MNDQMIRVISSPSSSTSGFFTLILAMCCQSFEGVAGRGGRCYRPAGDLLDFIAWQPSRRRRARAKRPYRTHTVFNQAPPLTGVNVFADNLPLVEATEREGAGWVRERASQLGRFVGGEPQQQWGRLANENEPVLHTFDRYGNRIDEVEFHPAWHQLMTMGVEHELHSLPWTSQRAVRAHRARRAVHDGDAGRGRLLLPDHDDLRRDTRAARSARAGRRVGAAADGDDI